MGNSSIVVEPNRRSYENRIFVKSKELISQEKSNVKITKKRISEWMDSRLNRATKKARTPVSWRHYSNWLKKLKKHDSSSIARRADMLAEMFVQEKLKKRPGRKKASIKNTNTAAFNNIDRYVYLDGVSDPRGGGRGDGAGVSVCVFAFDSQNKSAQAIADFLVNGPSEDGGYRISKKPPTPFMTLDTDDPATLAKKFQSFKSTKNRWADYSVSDYMNMGFETSDASEVLPCEVHMLNFILLTAKHGISIEDLENAITQKLTVSVEVVYDNGTKRLEKLIVDPDTGKEYDWYNLQAVENMVIRAAEYINSQSK